MKGSFTMLAGIGVATLFAMGTTVAITGWKFPGNSNAGGCSAPKPSASAVEYDWDGSRAKLLAIGQSVQLFRAHQNVKPVEQRENFRDAGLERGLWKVLTVPGKDYSIPASTFSNPGGLVPSPIPGNDFFVPYGIGPDTAAADVELVNSAWKRLGERMPILGDSNMLSLDQLRLPNSGAEILILRLDGTVDRIPYDVTDPKAMFRE